MTSLRWDNLPKPHVERPLMVAPKSLSPGKLPEEKKGL